MAQAGPRARYREQTRAEIKQAALRQLAQGGAPALALVKIAKELGLSGPALYRYFAGRDDLLDALITDAWADLAATLTDAARTGAEQDRPRARLHHLARAFRDWAIAQPHRYLLIAGTPVPDYQAPPETLGHARAALSPFLAVLAAGRLPSGLSPVADPLGEWATRDEDVTAWVRSAVPDLDPPATATALAGAVHTWTQLHGTVSLEVSGLFSGMGHDPAALLTAQIDVLADAYALD